MAALQCPPAPVLEKHSGRIRVILADDHADFLAVVTRLLEAEYEVVRTFGDGESLLHEIAAVRPDVVVLDISLPGMNGLEAARRLKAANGVAIIVFLTVHSDPDYVRAALADGALGYVVKSRLASDLLPGLRAALAGRSFVSPCVRLGNGGENTP